MPLSFLSKAPGRVLFSLLSILPSLAMANGYLQASGYDGALIGGPSQGYDQIKSPSFVGDVASGSAFTTFSAGGYYPGYADIFGEASSQSAATFGYLTESSSATSRGYVAYTTAGYGGNAAYASEVITVHGSGPIALTLHARLIGNTLVTSTNNVVDGAGARLRSQVSISPSGYVDQSQEINFAYDYNTGSVFDSLQTSTVNVADGNELRITGAMEESSGVQLLNGTYDTQAARTVTAFTNGNLYYWITLSPGASLSSESGYLYTAPAAVPEPTTLAGLALASMALTARRRRK